MRRIFLLFLILITSFYVLLTPQTTFAETFTGPPASCGPPDRIPPGIIPLVSFEKQRSIGQTVTVSVTFDATKASRDWDFYIKVPKAYNDASTLETNHIMLSRDTPTSTAGNNVTYTFQTPTNKTISRYNDSYEIKLYHSETFGSEELVCTIGTFTLIDDDTNSSQCTVLTSANVLAGSSFNFSSAISNNSSDPGAINRLTYFFQIYKSTQAPSPPGSGNQTLKARSEDFDSLINANKIWSRFVSPPSDVFPYSGTTLDSGHNYTAFIFSTKKIRDNRGPSDNFETFYRYCKFSFNVTNTATTPSFTVNGKDKAAATKNSNVLLGWSALNDATANSWVGVFKPGAADSDPVLSRYTSSNCGTATGSLPSFDGACSFPVPPDPGDYEFRMFKNLANDHLTEIRPILTVTDTAPPGDGGGNTACTDPATCSKGGGVPCGGDGVQTALGCLHTDTKSLINSLMKLAAGLAGAVTLILMIIGSVQMLTSGGNPEQIKKGRDQFVSAVIGLLFIIFSVTLLQIIGVDILNIPGFTK